MDYQKAHEIAKKVIKDGIKSVTNEEYDFVKKVYKDLTGQPWRGCSDCWQKLYIQTDIKLIQISTNYKPIMSQFKLKPNKIIQMHGFDPIGQGNLTDEKAINILRSSKKHIKNFAEFPENWESLIDSQIPQDKLEENKPITVDVSSQIDKVIEDSKEEVKEKLENMSKSELKKICEAYQYPSKEYDKLNKDKLVDYLLKKQFA